MKVKVLQLFRDKYTKKLYRPGETVDMTAKRMAEVEENLGAGYVEKAETGKTKGKEPEGDAPAEPEDP